MTMTFATTSGFTILVLVSLGNHEENGTAAKNAEALERVNYYCNVSHVMHNYLMLFSKKVWVKHCHKNYIIAIE